jgi:hypothetical protein
MTSTIHGSVPPESISCLHPDHKRKQARRILTAVTPGVYPKLRPPQLRGACFGGVQLIEQAPGPLGSPQDPQAPALGEREELLAETAKVENRGESSWLRHSGHSGFRPFMTKASNSCSHRLQLYSNMGISTPLPTTAYLTI